MKKMKTMNFVTKQKPSIKQSLKPVCITTATHTSVVNIIKNRRIGMENIQLLKFFQYTFNFVKFEIKIKYKYKISCWEEP